MKKYSVIAFDLDGTLTNPERGLVASFAYAMDKMGIKFGDKNELKRFIGPPLYDEWQKCFGFTPEESSEALRIFREFFEVYGWWDNELYSGVPELLGELKRRGKTVVLATSKPEVFAKKILKLFDIEKYFDFIGGASSDKTRDKKHEVLQYVFESVGSPAKHECILVGDRVYDADGARICGIDSMGVLWGHGSPEEVENAGFTYVKCTVEEVLDSLC